MNPHYLSPLFDPKSLLVYLPADATSSIAALLKKALEEGAYGGGVTWLTETPKGFPALTGVPRASLALIAIGRRGCGASARACSRRAGANRHPL